MSSSLLISHVSKKIGTEMILRDISLAVRPGEIFGIVGPDGAGKSSLLKIVAGVWAATEGHLKFSDTEFTRFPPQVRQQFGYMAFQEGLYEDLTALDNLEYTAAMYDVPRGEAQDRIRFLLEKTELKTFKDLAVKNFSGGMKQKLALCCALVHRPKVLLLDEPSTGVDPYSRRKFWDLLLELPEDSVSILLTTPYVEEMIRCHQVAFLTEGKVLIQGSPSQLYEKSDYLALDLWPEQMFPTMEVLEKNREVAAYRVRGRSLHVLLPKGLQEEPQLIGELKDRDIVLNRYEETPVELEDLFYLHFRQVKEEHPHDFNIADSRLRPLEPGPYDSMISVVGLSKSFGKVHAVQKIDFNIQPGQIFGIIGSNGAGKTTLIRMLCGLLLPSQGQIRIMGRDPLEHQAWLRKKLSYMSQEFSLYPDLTVRETITFFGGIFDLSRDLLRERVEWALEITGLEAESAEMVGKLSAGSKQRLSLGCTLVHDPALIFLDEPTSGVDPVTRRYFWDWISHLAEMGRTVVISTHYMNEAEQCDQVLLMHQGMLLAEGRPEEICAAQSGSRAIFRIEAEPLGGAAEIIKSLPWVDSVIPYGDYLHLITQQKEARLDELRRHLANGEVLLNYISPVPYTMEDVFVERIGTLI